MIGGFRLSSPPTDDDSNDGSITLPEIPLPINSSHTPTATPTTTRPTHPPTTTHPTPTHSTTHPHHDRPAPLARATEATTPTPSPAGATPYPSPVTVTIAPIVKVVPSQQAETVSRADAVLGIGLILVWIVLVVVGVEWWRGRQRRHRDEHVLQRYVTDLVDRLTGRRHLRAVCSIDQEERPQAKRDDLEAPDGEGTAQMARVASIRPLVRRTNSERTQ